MWYIEFLAHVTGGSKLGIGVYQILLLFASFRLFRLVCGKFWSCIGAYATTGFATVAIPLAILTPATNVVGLAYLSTVWPIWVYANEWCPLPLWLNALLFDA